ncbi:MAG TPA: hypothetical protein VFO42_02645 [Sphingomicrobium sp.]|nr:hypothetical protein [Sphingomicrobium sp.]
MALVHFLSSPDPVVPRAMTQLLRAIDAHGECCDPTILSLRSASLVRTVRRWLLATKGRNVHSDLFLGATLAEYERRWNSSEAIGLKFDAFERDSRHLLGVLQQHIPGSPFVRPPRTPVVPRSPAPNRGYRARRRPRQRAPG